MKLLDEENHKWYCFKDDELYYAKENHWGPLPYEGPKFDTDVTGGAISGWAIAGPVGAVIGAAWEANRKQQMEKNVPVRESLIERLTKDPQYEKAFKEWWNKTFPKKEYERETFVAVTTANIDSGLIALDGREKDGLKFRGVAKVVGKLYRKKKTAPVAHGSPTSETVSTTQLSKEEPSEPVEIPSKPKTQSKFCRECGAKIPRSSVFCEECGTNLG